MLIRNARNAHAFLELVVACCRSEVFDAWTKEAQQNPTDTYGPMLPMLVIDEANVFMHWAERLETHPTESTELRSLLDFFVKITKQEQQCHVVLVTAESAFQTWLDKRGCAVRAASSCLPACLPCLPACLLN